MGSQVHAALIRQWRKQHKLSREQVGVWTGRSVTTVARWERGLAEPQLSDLRAMERGKPGLLQAVMESCDGRHEVEEAEG
jgi:transcriptional regulator with XRE-family HTH domain